MVNSTKIDIAILQTKLEVMHADIIEIKNQTLKINSRVGSLENWKHWITGGLALLVFLLSLGLLKVFGG